MKLDQFANATLEDIARDPKKFGAPTYEEFCANPKKWRINSDQALISADQGSQVFTNVVKHHYYVDGAKVRSLEDVERECLNRGWNKADIDMQVGIEKVGGGKCEMHVNFRSKNVPKAP